MSDMQSAKAILLVSQGRVKRVHRAQVYKVQGSHDYTVVLSSEGNVCTCPAGMNGVRCYHVRAAKLQSRDDIRPRS